MPNVAIDFITFMAQRFATAFGPVPSLGCNNTFGVPDLVKLTMNGDVITAAAIDTNVLHQIFNGQIKANPKAAGGAGGTAPTIILLTQITRVKVGSSSEAPTLRG